MNWNLQTESWKRSTKILLGIATIWPPIYMFVFVLGMFSLMFFLPESRASRNRENIDLIQLERKIDRGEIKELRFSNREVIAFDRASEREYSTDLTNSSTRNEMIAKAQEHDANGNPRVAKIVEDTAQTVSPAVSPAIPIGFAALFGAHMLTILLMLGLMPLYVILAVKSKRLDDTMRIIWVVLLCMLGFFAMPVYWYMYIWRKPPGGLSQSDVSPDPGEGTFVKA